MITKTRKPVGFMDNVFLEREEELEEGSIKYSFYYKNVAIRHLTPDSGLAIKLASYHLVEKDLNSAYAGIKCLIELQENSLPGDLRGLGDHENVNFVIAKSLYQAAIVTYGKCFANASGGKKKSHTKSRGVKLEIKMIKDFPIEQKYAHEILINMRNEYIAHGGSTGLENSFTAVLVSPDNKIASNIFSIEAHAGSLDIGFGNTVLSLIDNLKKSLDIMQEQKRKVLEEGYLSKLTSEKIDVLAKYSTTLNMSL